MLSEYYSRQISLPELGINGQRKLKESRVAIVGIGGLGSIIALYLTLAGIGYIKIIDQDILEIHNIHRQVLYNIKQIGYPKVEVAAERLKETNPDVYIEPIPENLNALNAEKLIGDVDVVVDGLDNMNTRYIINRVCIKNRIPYVFGGAIGFEGNVSVFKPPETPCLECIFPSFDDRLLPTCETRGVIGATTGIIGTIEAMETIKIIAGINDSLKGKLLVCDFKHMEFSVIGLSKRLNCPACSGNVDIKPTSLKTIWICGSKTVNINPTIPLNTLLEEVYDRIKTRFEIKLKSSMMITFKYNDDVEVSMFKGGRMLIKNVNNEEQALQIYEDLIGFLR
ncbi:MAG: HesA/MoeB/ThiF family protein [Candidatus Methanomethylicia archaeon]